MTYQDAIYDRMKRLTETMHDREIALWRIFEGTSDLVCIIGGAGEDPGNGRFMMISPSFERELGWTEKQLLGQKWSRFVHIDDMGDSLKLLVHAWDSGLFKVRCRIMNSTCEDFRWYEWSCSKQSDTDIWYCIGRDITELVETHEVLEAALLRLSSLLESAVDGVITIDEQSVLIEPLNDAASKMFGYEKAELLGQTIEVLMPEPEKSQHQKAIDAYVSTGDKKVIGKTREVRGLHKDGTTFPIEIGVSESTVHGRRYFHGVVRDLRKGRR